MIITRLCGGLGNQMFQYAVGRCLAIKGNTNLFLDLSYYRQESTGNTPREYQLDGFHLASSIMPNPVSRLIMSLQSWRFSGKLAPRLIREESLRFNKSILHEKGAVCLDGYWQSDKYFAEVSDEIRKDFMLRRPLSQKSRHFANLISHTNSISVHVRRGDYITNPNAAAFHGVLDGDWYANALSMMRERIPHATYFIFSDDVPWVEEHMDFPGTRVFVRSNDQVSDVEAMWLMSKCNHNIIANSSFSWWGAWLNQSSEKIVIAPKRWFTNEIDSNDRTPVSWIRA